MANVQASSLDRAVRDGEYTFYFTHLTPEQQPNSDQLLSKSLGPLVQAGLMVQHDATMQHHGDSIINACYALFDIRIVDNMIQQKKDEVVGAMNGSGGMGGAVLCFVRGARFVNASGGLNLRIAANQLGQLGKHIFERSELERATAELRNQPL